MYFVQRVLIGAAATAVLLTKGSCFWGSSSSSTCSRSVGSGVEAFSPVPKVQGYPSLRRLVEQRPQLSQPPLSHHWQSTSKRLFSSSSSDASARSSLFRAVDDASSASSASLNGVVSTSRTGAKSEISPLVATLTKIGMIAFIAGMCLALPATLYPQKALYRLGIINQKRKERWALATGQFCSRWLLRLIPFCRIETIGGAASGGGGDDSNPPQPAIWVCNHTSMLDVFLLMAADQKLRGRQRRPIKIVYWKDLEANPVTALLFRQSGFIPVAMAPNKPGEENEYDKASFKLLLKDVKRAFDEDFDVALLPEGQLNPSPELGLQPVFGGAYTLAKMSRRPIYMMALYGIHKLWHPDAAIGMTVTSRQVKIRTYPHGRPYDSADEFKTTFGKVVGNFGATGRDLPEKELETWLTGEAWKQQQQQA